MAFTTSAQDNFTLVGPAHHDTVFSDFQHIGSATHTDLDAQLLASIRDHHPGMTVTTIPAQYADLVSYAAAGYARAELDTSDDSFLRWRFYRRASMRGGPGYLVDAYFFARYKYTWKSLEFIVYTIQEGYTMLNYILFPPDDDETVLSQSKITDALLQAVGDVQFAVEKTILVYDEYWKSSRALYEEVQKASWNDVILDKDLKRILSKTMARFFDSEKSYKDLGVPWKVS
jgi:transitional endoplasmic reticulum ATPase